jgi:hypothetical protein
MRDLARPKYAIPRLDAVLIGADFEDVLAGEYIPKLILVVVKVSGWTARLCICLFHREERPGGIGCRDLKRC